MHVNFKTPPTFTSTSPTLQRAQYRELARGSRRLEPETQARDLGRPRAICAMLGMQSEVCNHTLYHR